MKKNIIYIAHPVGGDVRSNLDKVAAIVREIALEREDVIPVAPYYLYCNALNDNCSVERMIGMNMSESFIESANVNEVWLFGDKISKGMQSEIDLAFELGIPVTAKTPQTKVALAIMIVKKLAE